MPVADPPLREETFEHGAVALRIQMPRCADELIDEEAFARDERLPYWADLWPSSRAISRWLIDHAPIAGRVIELGCGMGLPSLVMQALGTDIVATDYEPDALDSLQHNARHNQLRDIPMRRLDWRDRDAGDCQYDLAIGADVLYEQRNALALADLLPRIIAPGGRCIVADPGRRWLPQFKLLMRERNWSVTELAAIVEPGSATHAVPSTVRIIEFRERA